MTKQDDPVSEYMARVRTAAGGLPPRQRDELLRDLREHIDTARQDLPSESEAEVRDILDRLGDPFDIVEAAEDEHGSRRPDGDRSGVIRKVDRRRITMIVAGVILAVLVMILIIFVFFIGGGSSPTAGP